MGTALTGTEIKDTYDSLLKISDNGPLSGTAKLLTDGLGNDSVLYLGTAGLGIKSTSIFSFNLNDETHSVGYDSVIDGSQLRGQNGIRFGTGSGSGTERMRIASTGNVGIGTSLPAEKLSVAGAIITTGAITGHGGNRVSISQEGANGAYIQSYGANTSTVGAFTFRQASSDFSVTQIPLAITASGNVGIGTSSPSGKLHLSSTGDTYLVLTGGATPLTYSFLVDANDLRLFTGVGSSEKLRVTSSYLRLASGMGGIQFNGDTAAVNALDDYEEGTWAPVITDLTNDATMLAGAGGTYTKIGRQVTLTGYVRTSSLGSVTGDVYIKGLPFAVGGLTVGGVSISFGFGTGFNISAGQSVGGYSEGGTRITLTVWDATSGTTPMQASEWTSSGFVFMSFTYFV